MLKSWSIENFKPIVNSGELKLAPVTVLAGRNSSGKSSLLQSILMIAQTLSNPLPERALLPNGPLVQLGTFEDILSDFSNSRFMILKFELGYEHENIGRNLVDFKTSNYEVVVKFGSADQTNTSFPAIDATNVFTETTSLKVYIEYSGRVPFPDVIQNDFTMRKISEEEAQQFLEKNAKDRYPGQLPRLNYLGNFVSHQGVSSKQFLVTISHFLPTIFGPILTLGYDPGNLSLTGDQSVLEEATERIVRFFNSQIRYLGSLRANPDTTQRSFAPSSQLDEVGSKGEYAAVVYQYNQLAHIKWFNPYNKQIEEGTLKDALDSWSRFLGVAERISTETSESMGVAWKVVIRQGQKARTLLEVGGGLNHILPILVMGLLAPENTLLIIEEPEVTLHPRVQARLGDFYVGLSRCKKQCLIETHSENLISQLRYHIVQAGGMENSDCMIYFVSQDEQGAARFEQVEISPRGNIMNWPEGFFDETMHQEDKITTASIRRRARLAKNG